MSRRYAASAAVAAERGRGGRTRLTVLRSDGPLALRQTGEAAVYLVGAAAGPLGGDALELSVTVAPGARLTVRSVATTIALPGDGESRFTVRAAVGDGGRLDFAPEPTVAAAGCHHRALTSIELEGTAELRWHEELVLGRHGEDPGRHTSRVDVTRDGLPVLRHELRLSDRAVYGGPAVLAGAKAAGSVVLTGSGDAAAEEGVAVLPLAAGGTLITAVAPDALRLRRRLARGEELARS